MTVSIKCLILKPLITIVFSIIASEIPDLVNCDGEDHAALAAEAKRETELNFKLIASLVGFTMLAQVPRLIA